MPFAVAGTRVFCAIGVDSINNAGFLPGFVLGRYCRKPAACAVVVERRPTAFLMHPVSLAMRLAVVALLLLIILPDLRK